MRPANVVAINIRVLRVEDSQGLKFLYRIEHKLSYILQGEFEYVEGLTLAARRCVSGVR